MPATVNIGTLEGLLKWKADDAELNKSLDSVAKKADVSRKELNRYNKEIDHITAAYQRTVAAIDPVAASTQKYERAERSLTAALKAGIITQEQHNRTLSQAKEKYLSTSASTSTWRDEVQRLTNVITPFATRLADISVIAREVQGALLGSSKATAAQAGSAQVATASLTSLYAAALPIVAILGALAIAAGGVYVSFKGFSFLRDITIEGVKTQLVIEKLNNTLLATGSYSQMSSAKLVALAESYELLSGKSKEEIIAAETILARFETLNNQTYPEALRVTLAYSKAMGVTADAAASKLGPALEGNTRALGSLKEAGIVLSQSQRKTLQDMVEGGKVAEYQARLLEILREKVGDLSTEYDNNLSRQVDRAKIVLNDFGESIANVVIPAIEDVVDEIVRSLGGWDSLKKKVNEVGGAIGNFIRVYIYGLAIAYHDLMAEMNILISRHQLMIQILTQPFRVVSPSFQIKNQKEAQKSVEEHAAAIVRLTGRFNEHRTALEGNNEVYAAHGSAIDSVVGKNAELARLEEELTKIYEDQSLELQRIFDLRMLATRGPFSKQERITEEQKLNDAHKERILFLQQEEKFGTKIAESLAKQRKELKSLEFKAKIELQLATTLEPIEVDTKKLFKLADDSFEEAMERLNAIVAVEQSNSGAFQRTSDDYEAWIEDSVASWVEHFRSLKEISDGEMEAVRLAVERGLLSVSEGERAIAEIRSSYYSSQVDEWSGFVSTIGGKLSELGGSFGQFISQIASIAQSVQGVNSTAQSLGGWSSMMGAWGGTIAAFVEVYKYADSIIQKHKGEKYGTRGAVATAGGSFASFYSDHDSMVLSRSISDVIKAFEDSLRISASDLGAIEIRVRNDGKMVQAWVKGQWIGTFTDVNTAIREAVLTAISDPDSSLRGMSDLMQQALSDWRSPDMEGLLEGLGHLREISDLSLSPLVIDLHKSFLHFNILRDALNKLDQSSEAVIKAQRELTAAQNLLYQQTKAQLMGINLTASKAVQDLAGFQKGMEAVGDTARAGLESSIKAAQNQLKLLEQAEKKVNERPTGVGGGRETPEEGGIQEGISRLFSDVVETVDNEKENLKKSIADWTKQLEDVPKALTDKEIDLGIFTAVEEDIRKLPQYASLVVEMEKERIRYQYEQLRLQLVSIGAWERWAGIWEDLYNSAMQNAGKPPNLGGGTGGRSDTDREGVKDFIDDKKFELSLVGLTEYHKSLVELDKQYDDLIQQAGKDNKLRAELLALKQREIDLLEKEKKLRTADSFKEFVNPSNQFDKVRKAAADLIKEIEDSPFGDARKARMIGRVMQELDNQLVNLSKQAAVGLFGGMLSDMEKFGATEEQMLEARKMMAILEHEMRLANYALTIAQLETEGRLTEAQIAKFHEMFNFLSSIDPTKFIVPPTSPVANDNFSSSYSSSGESESLPDVLSRIQDKLAEWARVPLSETLGRAHELSDSFSELMEDVNKLIPFGWNYTAIAQDAYQKMIRAFVNDTLAEFDESGSELENTLRGIGERFTDINAAFVHLGATQGELERAERARLNAVQQALSTYLDPINERIRSRMVGERSILTGEQQFQNAQRQFQDLFAQIQSGDLSNLSNVVGLADQYEELMRSFTGGEGLRFGLKEIDDALSAITTLVPGFAAEMAEIGTTDNPMVIENQGMIDAIESNKEAVNTGNTLMLTELRTGVVEMKAQTTRLANIEEVLSNPLSVRDVA